jgi:hypothetical protein
VRDFGGGRVVLRRHLCADQIRGHRRIVRRELAGVLEDLDRLVELAKLLIRVAQMREQHPERKAAIGGSAEAAHGRCQRIDDPLEVPLILERLGEHEVAPRVLAVLGNDLARG